MPTSDQKKQQAENFKPVKIITRNSDDFLTLNIIVITRRRMIPN